MTHKQKLKRKSKEKIIMADEKDKKAEVGDVRPVFQQVGHEVCEKEASKPGEEVWIPVENYADALVLAHTLKEEKKKE